MSASAVLIVVVSLAAAAPARAQGRVSVDAPRPIDAGESLWTEELTWMEVRDAIRAGNTTVIVGTGGVEQNGPDVAGGKHNFVLHGVDEAPVTRLVEIGNRRAEYRARITAKAFRASMQKLRDADQRK